MPAERHIRRNVRAHDGIAAEYDAIHAELLCPAEQQRLKLKLKWAVGAIRTESVSGNRPPHALDFGCGTGNLTRLLIEMDFGVTAGDVSTKLLRRVRDKLGAPAGMLETMRLNGYDLAGVRDGTFDLVATYSVLHHVADYAKIVDELARVTRIGGVVFIDHEATGVQWSDDPGWKALQAIASASAPRTSWWRKLLQPRRYWRRLRRLINPRYQSEGDIHVWPDDHIEWDIIDSSLRKRGFEIILCEDYLFPSPYYPQEVFEEYKDRVRDIRLLVARRSSPGERSGK